MRLCFPDQVFSMEHLSILENGFKHWKKVLALSDIRLILENIVDYAFVLHPASSTLELTQLAVRCRVDTDNHSDPTILFDSWVREKVCACTTCSVGYVGPVLVFGYNLVEVLHENGVELYFIHVFPEKYCGLASKLLRDLHILLCEAVIHN